jgi:uncharacterized protein
MSDDLIRYDVLVSDALRGVVRQVLTEIASTGLPGEHHLYITIDTRLPGVRISSALRARFPEEMTIVLQHQFWELKVTEQGFEVGLSFSGVPERLLIPFSTITGFADPSVDFALKFETLLVDDTDMVGELSERLPNPEPAELVKLETQSGRDSINSEATKAGTKSGASAGSKSSGDAKDAGGKDSGGKADEKSGQVVSLDSFRKKS